MLALYHGFQRVSKGLEEVQEENLPCSSLHLYYLRENKKENPCYALHCADMQ